MTVDHGPDFDRDLTSSLEVLRRSRLPASSTAPWLRSRRRRSAADRVFGPCQLRNRMAALAGHRWRCGGCNGGRHPDRLIPRAGHRRRPVTDADFQRRANRLSGFECLGRARGVRLCLRLRVRGAKPHRTFEVTVEDGGSSPIRRSTSAPVPSRGHRRNADARRARAARRGRPPRPEAI